MPRLMDTLAELVGKSTGIEAVRERIQRMLGAHPTPGRFPPILIEGETGTGKGLVARLIHRAGPRAAGPFVEVNCAAIPETLLESELFGFERGAFTDAKRTKPGLFQSARGGSIFLDEVGLLSEALQAKLLTAIEQRRVRALGRTQSEDLDVWVIAATNEDLAQAVRTRRFRRDLYHRLAVLTVRIPPLRERREDIAPLAEHFLERARREYDLPGKRLTPEGLDALRAYRWPGNVRELANVMERVALLSEAPDVGAEILALGEGPDDDEPPSAPPMESALADLERATLATALAETQWNISTAAARLGLTRNKLRYRIDKYGLRPGDARAAARPRAARRGGHATPPAPIASAPPERRRLTLLRAAVTGGGPTWAASALRLFGGKIQSFGGRVVDLGESAATAIFGVDALEDAPRRAAHAAMAIQKAAERDAAEGVTLTLALHTAELPITVESDAPRLDVDGHAVTGEVLDRLVAGAAPGTIVLSPACARLLERRFALLPPATGAAGAGQRLVGRERSGLGVGGQVTRFVGRAGELAFIKSRMASVLRGHGQTVGIVGEAGIGKSRLLSELRLALRAEPLTMLRGRSLSFGQAVPYFLVIDILRQTLRVTEADDHATIVRRLESTLREIDMDVARWAPYLLQLLGVREGTEALTRLSDEAVKTGTLEALRQMLLNGSRVRPIVYTAEDLHWIDPASEACLAFLVDHLAGARILLVTTYRPGYRPPWTDGSHATQVALAPLSPEESVEVVRSVFQTRVPPEDLARTIVDKAEGNPFFLEEMAHVTRDAGHGGPPLTVPDTIQEVLRARMDRLPPETRRALQTMAVLGREFSTTLLGAVAEPGGEAHVTALIHLEFLREQTRGGETVYVFKHALTQEVAYDTVPPAERRALHARAAAALERLYAGRLAEVYERLADHWSRAEDDARAVEYLTRSAERAARGYAHEEAVRALAEAVTRLARAGGDEARLLELVLREASSLIPLGRFQEAVDLLLLHETRLQRLADASLAGRYHFLVGRALNFLGAHDRAAEAAQRAIVEATRCGDHATTGKAYSVLAMDTPMSGQAQQGIEYGRRAIALLEPTQEQWWLGHTHWVVGLNYSQVGDFARALEAEGRAWAIGEAIGDRRLQAYASWVTGIIYAAIGEARAGIDACGRALERAPDPLNRAIAEGFLGYTLVEAGDTAQAIVRLERAVQRLAEFRYRPFHGWFSVFLAEAYRLAGQVERAQDVAHQALVICRDARFRIGVGWAQQVLGRVARGRGAHAEATAQLESACETFGSIQSRYELARTYLDLALVAKAQGHGAAVARHLSAARRLFVELGVPHYVERVRRLAGEAGVPLGDTPG